MLSADGKVSIVFNGEIYNHRELRKELESLGRYTFKTDHSDTEALLYAFIEWGPECVHKLFGMFAFAIYDQRDHAGPKLHLVRDRIGVKPLYVTKRNSGEWLFASEIKAILEHPAVTPKMNDTAFWHYLTFIVSPAPMTMFDGVFKIPAGFWVTIDEEGHGYGRPYWDAAPKRDQYMSTKDISFDEAADQLLGLLRKSVERRMISDVPFGALLSGGVDSSLCTALMAELMDRPVKTFTIGYETHDEFNEFHHARRISERYKTDHHEALISSQEALRFLPSLVELQDEPIADNVCIPLYFLSRLVRENNTTVVQVGEGADENFLGYWWCEYYRRKEEEVYLPAREGVASPFGIEAFVRKLINKVRRAGPVTLDEDKEIVERARSGMELFLGGATCWTGSVRRQLTPDLSKFAAPQPCPIDGILPEAHLQLDSEGIAADYYKRAGDVFDKPEVLRKIPFMEMRLRLPEHLLMRVDKMTMAHSIEARVPFLDHQVVEFANRLPNQYKLSNGIGKRIVKKVSERYVDSDLLYRRKQGFGAPMDKWFLDDRFGKWCLAVWENSQIKREAYFDNDFVTTIIKNQISGKANLGFQIWTILNAVLWHEHWIARSTIANYA